MILRHSHYDRRIIIRSLLKMAPVAFFLAPSIANAVISSGPLYDILVTKTGAILNDVIIFLIGLAFVVFLWGVFKYVTTASLDAKAGAKETIIYGLIGLFIMLSAWGLVNILTGTFSFSEADRSAPVESKIPKAFEQPSSQPIYYP